MILTNFTANFEKKAMNNTPNLFHYATSELSQDAMFAWLIQWTDPRFRDNDPQLNSVAQKFLRLVLGKDDDFAINYVDVGRQWCNIDLWAEVNDNTFLIIEDKVGTSIHDNQLERYRKTVEQEYAGKRDDLCYAYVKTENEPESTLRRIEKAGYLTVSRKDILACLNEYEGDNDILLDYRLHLQRLDDQTESFRKLPVSKWGWYAWQGFYKELETRLHIESWDYVANPAGGFLGIWWHFVSYGEGDMYLQIEQGNLCFKISYDGERSYSSVRNEQHSRLMRTAKEENHPEIRRPNRFGSGQYMTIAYISREDVFGNGPVDIDAVVDKLKEYEELIDICCGL